MNARNLIDTYYRNMGNEDQGGVYNSWDLYRHEHPAKLAASKRGYAKLSAAQKKKLAARAKRHRGGSIVGGDGGAMVGGYEGYGGIGTRRGAAHNPWLKFVKAYRKRHGPATLTEISDAYHS